MSWARDEVSFLVLQSIWQAGPNDLDNVVRQSHWALEDLHFGRDLLSATEEAFAKYERNWQGAVAMRTFAAIVGRTLCLSPHEDVRTRCVCLLRRIRSTTLSWLRDLTRTFSGSSDDANRRNVSQRIVDVASACHLTFDDDVADLCECSMVMHDHTPSAESVRSIVARRSGRLAHLLEPRLRDLIMTSPIGLNRAVARLWPSFQSQSHWTLVEHSTMWVELEQDPAEDRQPLVQFNLLEGTLLVDGAPISRLPRDYVEHRTFTRLFGAVRGRRHPLKVDNTDSLSSESLTYFRPICRVCGFSVGTMCPATV